MFHIRSTAVFGSLSQLVVQGGPIALKEARGTPVAESERVRHGGRAGDMDGGRESRREGDHRVATCSKGGMSAFWSPPPKKLFFSTCCFGA